MLLSNAQGSWLTIAYIDRPRSRARALQQRRTCSVSRSLSLSVKVLSPSVARDNTLADAPVVFPRPEQPMKEQDGRRPIWLVRHRLRRLVEVEGQRHGLDRSAAAAAAEEVTCHTRLQVLGDKASQASGPRGDSEYHIPSRALKDGGNAFNLITSGVLRSQVSSESRI